MKRAPVKTPTLVQVEWADACSTHGWFGKDEIPKETKIIRMKTVGYVVRRTKREIAIAQGVSEHGKFSEIWTIPRPWVARVRRVTGR